MYASKGLIVAAAVALLGMTATSVYGLQNGIDVLMSDNMMFNYLRLGLVGALGVLLLTQVPRSIATRAFVGVVAVVLLGLNGYYMLGDQLYVFDGMMFALVAIIMALEAIEPQTSFAQKPQIKTVKVRVE